MAPLAHIYGESHVAAKYGLEEAIFLHSLMFWYRTNRGNDQNFHDGRWWTYNSVKAFEEIFPWWNAGQIRRIIARCREKGAMLAGNYNEDQRDRTSWYTPSDELLELYGESANCICRNQQMQSPESAESFDKNGKCNIRNTWGNHGETDMKDSPYSPPEGDSPAIGSADGDRHSAVPNDRPGGLPDAQDKPPQEESKPKTRKPRREKSAPAHAPDAFDAFWKAYPRKDDRKAAIRAWDKLRPDRELCRTMYDALKRQRGSEQWAEAGGKYIPLFSTWLNGRKWENQGVDLSLLSKSRGSSGGWAPDPEVTS